MFTGLTETKGVIKKITGGKGKLNIWISAPSIADKLKSGDSVAVDGVCQTVVTAGKSDFMIQAMEETLKKTTFSGFSERRIVNLEKALTLETPLGGHLVQGHVSGTGTITEIIKKEDNRYLKITAGEEIIRYCIKEGSVAVDGISLTVADTTGNFFLLNIIPETWEKTTLKDRRPGDRVNIETDLIGRYIVSFLEKAVSGGRADSRKEINISDLSRWGY